MFTVIYYIKDNKLTSQYVLTCKASIVLRKLYADHSIVGLSSFKTNEIDAAKMWCNKLK